MDVSQKDWFFGSVLAAYSAGIAQVSARPSSNGRDISRQDLAVMIYRTIKFANPPNTPNENVVSVTS